MENSMKKNVVGIGLGPSNLSLAIAMLEDTEEKNSVDNWVFLEQSIDYFWHASRRCEDADTFSARFSNIEKPNESIFLYKLFKV